jgi:hypothetical protein
VELQCSRWDSVCGVSCCRCAIARRTPAVCLLSWMHFPSTSATTDCCANRKPGDCRPRLRSRCPIICAGLGCGDREWTASACRMLPSLVAGFNSRFLLAGSDDCQLRVLGFVASAHMVCGVCVSLPPGLWRRSRVVSKREKGTEAMRMDKKPIRIESRLREVSTLSRSQLPEGRRLLLCISTRRRLWRFGL